MSRRLPLVLIAAVAMVALGGVAAHATTSPFGIATPDSTGNYFGGPLGPIFAWIAFRQAEFYRALTAAMDEWKATGGGLWLLFGLSFAYGVFHAVGPGHGKAVITSYVIASRATARRGIALSFLAAMVQALSAIVIVAIGSVLLRVTAMAMTSATDWIELVSYGAIMLFGAWLLWVKIRGGHHHHHHFYPAADGHSHSHDDHDHARLEHGHIHTQSCGHAEPFAAVATPRSMPFFVRAWTAVLAVGIRPCSGAIIVLVFALAEGMFAAGVAATFIMALGTGVTVALLATLAITAKDFVLRFAGNGSSLVTRLARGVEIGGAAAVLVLGMLLFGGALYTSGLPS